MTRITSTLSKDICAIVIISRANLLRMRNISVKNCSENQSTCFVCKERFVF